jgi:DNA (cytosine-5)-methyltransferase 1
MDVTDDVTCTLRAEAHHPPCIMQSAGFCTEHSAKSRSIGYEDETSPTLRAGVVPAAIAIENHPADSRVGLSEDNKIQTLTSRMGTGGGNVPMLLKIRCGKDGGGKGALIQDNKSATLATNNDQTLFEPCAWDGKQISSTLTKQNAGGNQRMPDKDNFNCIIQPFGISAKDSNAMKSSNPHSGIYEAETSRTIDTSGGNPACNQGGIAIVEGRQLTEFHVNQRDEVVDLKGKSGALMATHSNQMQTFVLQGSMIGRKDENGPQGDGVNEDVCFTLDATDRHAVYCMTTGSYTDIAKEQSPTLMARDYKDPNVVTEPVYGIGRDTFNQGTNAKFAPSFEKEIEPPLMAKGPGAVIKAEPEYTVRRLTPTECARLQGFPDWWCRDLGTEKPTSEEVYFWYKVFETHRKVMGGSGKPKTEKQIRKWLENPYSDSAEYKLWGNGVALPCVYFVMCGIVWANAEDAKTAD